MFTWVSARCYSDCIPWQSWPGLDQLCRLACTWAPYWPCDLWIRNWGMSLALQGSDSQALQASTYQAQSLIRTNLRPWEHPLQCFHSVCHNCEQHCRAIVQLDLWKEAAERVVEVIWMHWLLICDTKHLAMHRDPRICQSYVGLWDQQSPRNRASARRWA